MKLNLKEIDFKQFFLTHGEWVGIAVALAIMLPPFYYGAKKALTSGSATSNATSLNKISTEKRNAIQRSEPDEEAKKIPPEAEFQLNFVSVDWEKFRAGQEWFVPSSIEDTKRRQPAIMAPGDFVVNTIRSGYRTHKIYYKDGKPTHVEAFTEQQVAASEREKKTRKKLQDRLKKLGQGQLAGQLGQGGGIGMGGPGTGGGMGMGMRGGMGMGGMGGMGMGGMGGMGMGGMGMGGQGAQQRNPSTIKIIKTVEIDKVKESDKLVEDLEPCRMVVVTGTFPLKQQLEAFRSALRFRTLNDLIAKLGSPEAAWRFLGFEIERRVLNADGTERVPWEPYDQRMLAALRRTLAHAVETEKESDQLLEIPGIVNRGLVWARPKLDPDLGGKWPEVELTALDKAIEEMKKVSAEAPTPVRSQLRGKFDSIDPLDPTNPLSGEEPPPENKPADSASQEQKKDPAAEDEIPVPEKCLVRFIDVTVLPGFTYEYRVKVKIANPNYDQKNVAYPSLAKNKEIKAADWTVVPKIAVPHDVYWYATDERPDRERINIQVHRWLPWHLPDEKEKNFYFSVADWAVVDRLPAYRGEYLGKTAHVDLASWSSERDSYEIAKLPKSRSKVPVDFTVRQLDRQYPGLLVDYAGGKGNRVRFNDRDLLDESPVQMLVLNPDGRLVLRSSADDVNDEERKKRMEAYKTRIEEVKKATKPGPGKGLFDPSSLKGGGSPMN